MGVLYHSHSPLMILDKIITLSKPKHIIIDTFQPSNDKRAKEEGVFTIGQERRNLKITMMGWYDENCSLPFVLSTSSNTWKNILDMCGYKCKEKYDDKRTTCILTTKEIKSE